MGTRNEDYELVIKQIRKKLKKSGIKKTYLPALPASQEDTFRSLFDHALSLYDISSGDQSLSILKLIEMMFGSTPATTTNFNIRTAQLTKFYCPELKILMYQPCEISSCQYHTFNSWTGNCILRFLTKQSVQELGYDDLSYLVNIPQAELKATFIGIKRSLRNGALKEAILKEVTSGLFDRKFSPRLCPVCERKIVPSERVVSRGYRYCSQICAEYKPPLVLKLEHEFCLEIIPLLKLCIDKFSSTKEMSTALGISRFVFEDLCKSKGIEIPQRKI